MLPDGEESDNRHNDGALDKPGSLERFGQPEYAGANERDEDVGHHHAFWVAACAEAAHLARHLDYSLCPP